MPKVVRTETTIKEFDADNNVIRTIINTQQIDHPEPADDMTPIGLYL